MSELLMCWLLEAGNLDSLRIGAADHVTDHTVFAGRVEALQHDQQRTLAFGIKPVLQFGETLHVTRDFGRRARVALVLALVAGVDIGQLDLAIRRHKKFLGEIHPISLRL